MKIKSLVLALSAIFVFKTGAKAQSAADSPARQKPPVVHLAKLQIDPTQLENYKNALKEEIETSVRIEPGVLSLEAVAEKDNPSHITILEVYTDTTAYKAHLTTPHFKKYKSATKEMVKSLELVDTVPVVLGMKGK